MDWMFTLNNLSFTRKLIADDSLSTKKKSKRDEDYDKDKELSKKIISYAKKNFELFNNLKKASDDAGYKVDDLIKRFEIKLIPPITKKRIR